VLPALALSFLLQAAPVDVGAPEERRHDPYALTLSGGVSLGSYEAGLNWTLVRIFRVQDQIETVLRRRPRLVAVTGASAGSINALLVAALYCEAEDSTANTSVDDNLLRDAWLSVSLDALLPGDPRAYRPDDAVLASAALDPVVKEVRKKLFEGGMRFRPGCRLPVGLTVTRVHPLQQQVAGLNITSQRAALPLLFDVDPNGAVHFERQSLRGSEESLLALADTEGMGRVEVHPEAVLQSLLASAAFPAAFRSRTLCECAADCGGDPEATEGVCPGPDDGRPLTGLTCAAQSAAQGGRPLKVCMRRFVDGGVFDNAPVGLALEQSEAFWQPRPLKPLTAVFVDPDIRRLQPRRSEAQADRSLRGASALLTFAGNLVNTARGRELARAAQAGRWNRTTPALLQTSSRHILEYVGLIGELLDLDGPPPMPMVPPALHGTLEERARVGRVVEYCVQNLASKGLDRASQELAERCANWFRGDAMSSPLDDDPKARTRATVPLTGEELADLTGTLSRAFSNPRNEARRTAERVLGDRGSTPAQRVAMGQLLSDRLEIISVFEVYLAEELGGIAHGSLPEDRLVELRADILGFLGDTARLGTSAARIAFAQLEGALGSLAGRSGPGNVPVLAARALAEVKSQTRGVVFGSETLTPLLAELNRLPPGQTDADLLRDWARIDRLVQLRGRLQALIIESGTLAADARAVLAETAGERQLALSTRFSPLAGSQLFNFAGFLDLPLREMDYYAGVYDALHTAATVACSEQESMLPGRPMPVRIRGSWALDLHDADTQACIGASLGELARLLGILDSAQAAPFIRALARAELAGWLGSASEAERVLRAPEWGWIGPPPDLRSLGPPGIVAWVLLSQRTQCDETSTEAVCIADLGFTDFLGALKDAGYVGQSPAMRLALDDPRRFLQQTAQRGLDRAATIELTSDNPSELGARNDVMVALGAGEVWTRGDVPGNQVRFVLDPSSVPSVSLAGGSWWPIGLAHLVPYRMALDVANGGLALSWIEPVLRIGPHFSVLTTLQLVDIEFGEKRTSSTFGLRPAVHFAGLTVNAGPRFAVHWSGGTDWGVETGVSVLQDRIGLSVGWRQINGGLHQLLVALSLSDVNGMIYWLTPWAPRKPPEVSVPEHLKD